MVPELSKLIKLYNIKEIESNNACSENLYEKKINLMPKFFKLIFLVK